MTNPGGRDLQIHLRHPSTQTDRPQLVASGVLYSSRCCYSAVASSIWDREIQALCVAHTADCHKMALPLSGHGVHLIGAYYSSIDPERMKG